MKKIAKKLKKTNRFDKISKFGLALLISQAFVGGSSEAALRRVGPTLATNINGGFPEWYQDSNLLALDLCLPKTQEELDSGLCLILRPDVPNQSAPETFPGNFGDEHFFFGSGSLLTTNSATAGVAGGRANLTLALEAAFANGAAAANTQVTFGRVRIKILDLPSAGDYRIIHPYGDITFPNMPAGGTIFFTDDIGINCAQGDFSCALASNVGPFLVPVNADGTRKAPVVINGSSYLSDGGTLEQVSGSPFGTNKFRIEGPNIGGPGVNFVETDLFTVVGRIHSAPIPTPVKVLSAAYSRSAATGAKVDVFAESEPTAVLSYSLNTTAPGATIPTSTGTLMSKKGNSFVQHGQSIIANAAALPPEVTVFNNSDNPVSFQTIGLTDKLSVSSANYDPRAKTLSIVASSSDQLISPVLSVDLGRFGGAQSIRQLVAGSGVISGIAIAPPEVTILSSAGGRITVPVQVGPTAAAGAKVVDDVAATNEDVPVSINIGANDGNIAAGSYSIAVAPLKGSVVLNQNLADPTLTTVTYTPALNSNGVDTFRYVAKGLDGVTSTVATVTVNVSPVNDAPTAVNDAACAVLGKSTAVNVVGNDSDVDGNLVPASAVLLSGAAGNRGSATMAGGVLTYTPPASLPAGVTTAVDTFQYQVSDSAGASSVATVSVNLYASEVLTVTSAQYTTKQLRWVIVGTSNINACGNTVTATNGNTGIGAVIGSAPVDLLGGWQIQAPGSTVPVDATRTISVKTTMGTQRLGVPVTIK